VHGITVGEAIEKIATVTLATRLSTIGPLQREKALTVTLATRLAAKVEKKHP
jgi:hypothetical protein